MALVVRIPGLHIANTYLYFSYCNGSGEASKRAMGSLFFDNAFILANCIPFVPGFQNQERGIAKDRIINWHTNGKFPN